jgi:hypothetical protein
VNRLITKQSTPNKSATGRATIAARVVRPIATVPRAVGVVLAAFGILAALSTDDGPVLCPIRRCTGGYCPACGMTRSGGRLLRGDVSGAWQQHPYLFVLLPQLLVGALVWISGQARHGTTDWGRVLRVALAVNAAIMVAIWSARLITGAIPVPFLA